MTCSAVSFAMAFSAPTNSCAESFCSSIILSMRSLFCLTKASNSSSLAI